MVPFLLEAIDACAPHALLVPRVGGGGARGRSRYGRDVLARLLFGGQVSLAVGLSSMLASMVFGVFIIAILLFSGGYLGPEFHVPMWVVLSAHAAMGLGTLSGGWRIVHTMGSRVTRLRPVGGFCAETAGAATLFMAGFVTAFSLMADALRDALEGADLVVTTGGLGPTPDDLTREAIAAVLGWNPAISDSEYPYVTALAVDGNTVYIGSEDGSIYAFEAR